MKLIPILTLAVLALLKRPAEANAAVQHYEFLGSPADSLGGPDLVPAGGTLAWGGYLFGRAQGPMVQATGVSSNHYTLELRFALDATNGYRKLLDFNKLRTDTGLYCLNGGIRFYPLPETSPVSLFPGRLHHLAVSRDRTSRRVQVWVDGIRRLDFTDPAEVAVFSSSDRQLHVLRDDMGPADEHPSGYLGMIRFHGEPLAPEDVSRLAAIPALPFLRSQPLSAGRLRLFFHPESNRVYRLQTRAAADAGSWVDFGAAVSGNSPASSWQLTVPAEAPEEWFRLVASP